MTNIYDYFPAGNFRKPVLKVITINIICKTHQINHIATFFYSFDVIMMRQVIESKTESLVDLMVKYYIKLYNVVINIDKLVSAERFSFFLNL